MVSKTDVTEGLGTTKVQYNFCSINICGLSTRSKFVLEKYCFDRNIDVLAVQESYSSDPENQKLGIMKSVTDENNSVNRGAMIFINSNRLQILPLPELSRISTQIDTAWGLVTGPGFRQIVGSVYLKLNYKDAVKDFLAILSCAKTLQHKLKAHGISVFGDYNARHTLWGDSMSNKYGDDLADQLNFMEFTLLSSEQPTFLSSNGQSHIDFLVNTISTEHNFTTLKTDEEVELFSGAPVRGHVPVHCCYVSSHSRITPPPKPKLDLATIDWDLWTQSLDLAIDESSQYIDLNSTAEEKWDLINAAFQKATRETCSTKLSSIHSKPYWTSQLSQASLNLRKAKRAYSKRNTLSNKATFDSAKESFDNMRKTECQRFILMRTKSLNVAQATKFWKRFNQMFASKRTNNVETLVNDTGDPLTEPVEIEEALFSSFFECRHLVAKGKDFDKIFLEEVDRLYSEILEDPNLLSTENQPHPYDSLSEIISIEEVNMFIKNYKSSGKSFDNFNFHPQMLKHLGMKARLKLVDLYNTCMKEGTWAWNIADVIFLKKDGKKDYSQPGSYRPISITSYIGKIFEQILASRLENHFSSHGFIDKNQEGFRKQRNTIRYLNRLDHDIRLSLEKKYTVICLFIDFEKAFDSVWKKGLMKKLFDAGVTGKMWMLINSFLFTRKVKLVFNGFTGFIRACREFGLPQGSALSPVLFRFFVHDLAISLNHPNVSTFKFADDGTLKVSAKNTHDCLALLEMICKEIHDWSTTWRMIINCDVSKTELICFGTAEKDASLIPPTFSLGQNIIQFVDKTKVLGLIIDKDLSYCEHAKYINKKVLYRWVSICKYTNRNWGFKQHIIVRLFEVLLCTCICYAGIVWINQKSLREVESTWYRVLKAATGAVFNIKLINSEILLGLPPLETQNRMNSIKHLLKLNIFSQANDPLKESICSQLEENNYGRIVSKVKDTFQFLKWKNQSYKNHFSTIEISIIEGNRYEHFGSLSARACSYTKAMVAKYTEVLWQNKANSLFQLDGFHEAPRVSTKKLVFHPEISRKTETLSMSLFYPNNLFKRFLHRFDPAKFSSAACLCGNGSQDPLHILLYCKSVQWNSRLKTQKFLSETQPHSITAVSQQEALLLSWSREPGFLQHCVDIIKSIEHSLIVEIIL